MSRSYSLDDNTNGFAFFNPTSDPTKVRISERECDEDEPKLLETTVGRVVSLLPVTPDRSSGELEASVDKLFEEGGSGEQADQGDSAGGGHGVGVQLVDVSAETVVEDVTPVELQRQKKRKTKVVDAGVNIAEAGVDYIVRTSVPIMTNATTATPTADPAAITNERLVGSSVFGGNSSFAGGSHPTSGIFLIVLISLSVKVRMRVEYNIKEKRRLKSVVEDKYPLLKSMCDEIESLKAYSVKLQNDSLADQVHQLEASSDEKMKEVNEKFDKLCIDFVDMAIHLEENFYPHLLTTIFGRWWLVTHGMELAIAKCLNSTDYLSALRAAIDKASEKVMLEGLSAEDALAKKLGLVESQPHVDQLMVHIHHSPDQRVVALRGVFVPLSEPLFTMDFGRYGRYFGDAPDTTTALSVTSISVSTISPISTDDYEIAHTKGGQGAVADVEAVADEGVDPFPNVSGAELDVSK
nr:hypothetical protein [Tanacetum cinerariifolium]